MRIVFLALMALWVSGCGSVQKMAVSTTAGVLKVGALEMETENSWEIFRDSILPGVKTMEAMAYVSPENTDLNLALAKGYTGLGYGVYETLFLPEYYRDEEESSNKFLAETSYSRAIYYGAKFLEAQGITLQDLIGASNNGGEVAIGELLSRKLGNPNQDELEGVLYTAQAWGALINLKKSVVLMGQAPIVKGMFDWSCQKNPNLAGGICPILLAVYDLGRPSTFGGKPEAGRASLEALIKENPENLLARVAYLQFWVIPRADLKLFREQKEFLSGALERIRGSGIWSPGEEYPKESRQALYNAIALKRFELMSSMEKEIF